MKKLLLGVLLAGLAGGIGFAKGQNSGYSRGIGAGQLKACNQFIVGVRNQVGPFAPEMSCRLNGDDAIVDVTIGGETRSFNLDLTPAK